jgi:putative PIN family toxin of toxin-antitoxin system
MEVIVLDTNVLLDLFVFDDFRTLHLKQQLLEGKFKALATPVTLAEFADVIARPLFSLEQTKQEQIYLQWRTLATILEDKTLKKSPWKCQDPDDQVFLDLAFTVKPCTLISKDNEVLRFASQATKEQIIITSDYPTQS